MSCYICRSSACIPSFHSIEEQEHFQRAEDAYDEYLQILEECRQSWCAMEENIND